MTDSDSMFSSLEDHLDRVAGACLCIAAADGELDDGELVTLIDSITVCSNGEADRDTLRGLLQQAGDEITELGLDRYAQRLAEGLDEDARLNLLIFAAATAASDGTMSEIEREVFQRLAEALGYGDHAETIFSEVGKNRLG